MNTKWTPFEQYGCYYRLCDGVLQACPMLLDGAMESEESACDVDFSSIDADVAEQARIAEAKVREEEDGEGYDRRYPVGY